MDKEFKEDLDSIQGIDNSTVDTVDRRNIDTSMNIFLAAVHLQSAATTVNIPALPWPLATALNIVGPRSKDDNHLTTG